MDLGSPLATLVGPLHAAILRVLSRADTDFGGRQIHRVMGIGSSSGVHSALNRLVETGVVQSTIRPYATLYRANREHVLWPVVEAGLNAGIELRNRYESFAKSSAPEGATVAIYGSLVHGDADAQSDIDIVIITPDDIPSEIREEFAYLLADNIETWSGNRVQTINMTESELRTQNVDSSPLVATWRAEADVLVGHAFDQENR